MRLDGAGRAQLSNGPLTVHYRPSPGQLAFHQARGRYIERGLECGTGAGKTRACAFEVADITARERSDLAIIAAPDFPQLQISVYKTLRQLFGYTPTKERSLHELEPYATFNEGKKTLSWANGWEWRFASMDDPTSVEGTPEAAIVWLNEARLVRKFDGDDGAWDNMTRRLRGHEARNRYAFFDTHSPTAAITRTFQEAGGERYHSEGGTWEEVRCKDPQQMVWRWGLADAVAWGTIDRASAERIIRKYENNPSSAARILHGRYARAELAVYDAWDHLNVTESEPVKVTRTTYGVDWGWNPDPAAILAIQWTGSTCWIVSEVKETHLGIKGIAAKLKAMQETYGVGVVRAGGDRPEHIDELRNLGFTVEPATQRVKDACELVNDKMRGGEVRIHARCKRLLEEIDNYENDRDKEKPKDGQDDHLVDAMRYGIVSGPVDMGAGVW